MNRIVSFKRFISLAIVTLILIGSIAAISSVIHDFSYFPSDTDGGKSDSDGSGTCESEDGAQENQKVPEGNGESKGEGIGEPEGEGKGAGACPTCSNKISPEGGKPHHIPLFYTIGATNTHYLKAIVGVTYDGEMWVLGEEPRYIYKGENLGHKVKNYQSKLKDEIEIKPIVKFPPGFIPISLYTDKVSLLDSLDYYPEQNIFYSSKSFSSPYSFTTTHYHFKESTLETSEAVDIEKYLQLPTQITDRTKQLAREITKGYETPYLKAKAIENYLKTNYEYDLNYTRAPEGREPNDWFLFEEKRGVCANFNSAFVILARSAGISSKVVSGYMIKSTSGTQTVFADQAHCWAEVGLEVGWITFDATGGGEEKELIPTDTEITSMSEVVIAKGHDFIVEGTVLTESGEKVDGMPIDVFLNENKEKGGMLCGQGETGNGYFEIKCPVSPEVEVGDYHVIAHAIGNSKYGESWSDPPIKVISHTEINLFVPEIAKPGETVKIKGNLVEDTGKPVSGEEIRVFVEGEEIARTTTNKIGVFSTEHAFPKKGNYSVKAIFKGTAYFLESSKEAYIEVTLVSLDIETNNTFVRGEDVDLCGRAQLGDSPLTNEPLNIQVGEQVVNITTDENGACSHSYHVNQTQALGLLELKYVLPEFETTKSQEVVVKAHTELNASVPDTVKPGDTITIGAVLRDDIGNPLEGKLITLFIPGITSEITNQTYEKGETSFSISIPEEVKNAKKHVNLHFRGSGFYLPSSLSHPLNINLGGSFLWFGLILLTMGLLSVVFFGVYKYKWRKTDKGEAENEKSAEGVVKVEGAEEDKIRIVFPQIKENFPNVWGVGEALQISCAIPDEGTPSSKGKMEVQIDGTVAYASDLDGTGQCHFTQAFNEKGEYSINANFSDGFEFGKLSGTTRIRIVNYREEMTKLYKSFLESLKKCNFAVHEETTPREVYEMQVTKFQDAEEAANEFIGCFEIARYSTHAIGRKDYEKMVIARNELEGKA